jgi:formate hydrogenlyase transcriptional activator
MFFLARFTRKLGKKIEAVSQADMDLLSTYAWPGNIRELQNLVERAVVLSQGPVLRLDRTLLPAVAPDTAVIIPEGTGSSPSRPASDRYIGHVSVGAVPENSLALEAVEKRHILAVLQQTAWVIEGAQGAARILNLHPNTLRSRMKKLGIRRSAHEIS